MENKKFEQLIDLIINEQEDKAKELFHEIVVEKSREIYESIMDEEMMDEEGQMVGEVGDLMDEIEAESSGEVVETEDEADIEFDDSEEDGGEEGEIDAEVDAEAPQTVDDVKDKFEELLADFERILGGEGDTGDDMGGEEEVAVDDEESAMMEAVSLKKVPGLYGSKIGGDDGANTKSPALTEPKIKAEGVKPVKFSGDSEAVPTSPKAPSNYGTKGEKDLPGAGNFKNVPGKDNFKEKGDSAPKPVTSQASGVNTKSPVSKG